MLKTLLAGAVAGSLLLGAGAARADGDALGPRATGVGESLRAAATGALATVLNPAGLTLARNYVVEASYGYRHADKTHVQAVSICDSVTTRVGACVFYNHVSADPTVPGDLYLHEGGITMSTPMGPLSLGVTNKYVSYNESMTETVPVDSSHKGFVFDAGLTYRVFPTFTVAAVGYNLLGSDDSRYATAMGFGVAFNAMDRLLLAADAKYDFETENARYGGGVEYLFTSGQAQQGMPIRGGYVYDSGSGASYITGGLGFITTKIAIDSALRKQVNHGSELLCQFSLRLFLPG